MKTADYRITIGIECHVQLATKTKLFSEVDNDARGKAPNSCVSPVDYALPGQLPRLNEQAIRLALRAGKALNAVINPVSRFDRKHYYYPDLPKGYQISQFYQPIIGAGQLELPDGSVIRIEHAHLEEDAGKLEHFDDYSLVDLNRAGTPLLEIVSMPDLHSAAAARDYCKELWRVMVFAGVTLGDLYNGNMRFDVNISLAKPGATELGTRTEIKNLNSFRSVERAVEYEAARQAEILARGGKIKQETRGWSDASGRTTSQRSKEEAQDYRYMPEPDLPPLNLSAEFIAAEQALTPKLPAFFRAKFADILPADTLEILLDFPPLMEKLTEILEHKNDDLSSKFASATSVKNSESAKKSTPTNNAVKLIANLFTSVLLAEEKSAEWFNDLPAATDLAILSVMSERGELSSTAVKEVFLKLFDPQMRARGTRQIAKELNLLQENDLDALTSLVERVLSDPKNAAAIADFRAGSEKVLGFLVGQVMKASHGQANPALTQKILREKLRR